MIDFVFFVLFGFKSFQIQEIWHLPCFIVFFCFLFCLSKQDLQKHEISLEVVSCLIVSGFLFSLFDLNSALLNSGRFLSIQGVNLALLGFTLAFLISDFLTNSGNFFAKYPDSSQGLRSLLVFLFSFLLLVSLSGFLVLLDFWWLVVLLFLDVVLVDYFLFGFLYAKSAKFKNFLDNSLGKFWFLLYFLVFCLLIQSYAKLESNSLVTYLLAFSFFYIEIIKANYPLNQLPLLRGLGGTNHKKDSEDPESNSVMGGGDALVLSGVGIFLGPILLVEVLLVCFIFLFCFSLISKIYFQRIKKKKEFIYQIPFVPIVSFVSLFFYI